MQRAQLKNKHESHNDLVFFRTDGFGDRRAPLLSTYFSAIVGNVHSHFVHIEIETVQFQWAVHTIQPI